MLPQSGGLHDAGQPNSTLYIQNLNEKVASKHIISELQKLYSPFGELIDIKVKSRLSLRGQAFIIYREVETARRALEATQGERLYGKSMVVKFAKYKSDLISKTDGTFEIERRRREQDRIEKSRHPRITRRQLLTQAMTNPTMQTMMMGAPGNPMAMGAAPQAPQMFTPQMVGGELQIPSRILYLQNLPAIPQLDKELQSIFRRYPGLNEVRLIPNRPDLAFVEYETEMQAAAARAALDNHELAPGNKIRVAFARR